MYLAVLAFEIRVRRDILHPHRESEREASAGVSRAIHDVCECVSDFVARVPCLNDPVHLVHPWHCDG